MKGEDSREQRDVKIAKFKNIPEIRVFIVSLKCGYAGLNLEMANKLIFL
jgi:SNF2 family DNA or RNA helicase